jgi:hypothetical protein
VVAGMGVRAKTVTAAFTRDLLRYLQRARNNPYLRFELPPRHGSPLPRTQDRPAKVAS